MGKITQKNTLAKFSINGGANVFFLRVIRGNY